MADVFDVAKYILEKQGEMSTLKLQKLCYYSQAWSIAWTEKPIFDEEFQAWANGPVCPDLFWEHQGLFMLSGEGLRRGNSLNLSPDQKDTIDRVLEFYGPRAPYDLREQTHLEDPWKNARRGCAPGESSKEVIPKDSMGKYYGSL